MVPAFPKSLIVGGRTTPSESARASLGARHVFSRRIPSIRSSPVSQATFPVHQAPLLSPPTNFSLCPHSPLLGFSP